MLVKNKEQMSLKIFAWSHGSLRSVSRISLMCILLKNFDMSSWENARFK